MSEPTSGACSFIDWPALRSLSPIHINVMASKNTLNAKNLEALGAAKLAELLMELTAGDAAAKRRLRLELAGSEGPELVAKEVSKRLTTIARSRSFVDWHKHRELVQDLDAQRRAISEQVAKTNPNEALDLMWRFLSLAQSVYERCDDSSGSVGDVFSEACEELGEIAKRADVDPIQLADQTYAALNDNNYGQFDGLIKSMAPSLGTRGLEHLKERIERLAETPVQKPPEEERKVIGYGSGGNIYADQLEEQHRKSVVRIALKDIADAMGDVDGFIAASGDAGKSSPQIATEIARRLLDAGRADEALTAINSIDTEKFRWLPSEWEDTRLEILKVLGKNDEAQTSRWKYFEQRLSTAHLRAYLKRLSGFDDVEVEQKAFEFAFRYPSFIQALSFFTSWPELRWAEKLILERYSELDGDHYEVLSPAAEALAGKFPLAATLLLRAMITFALEQSRTKRYRHAARHLAECDSLSSSISDFGQHPTHADFVSRLRSKYSRRTSFWSLVP